MCCMLYVTSLAKYFLEESLQFWQALENIYAWKLLLILTKSFIIVAAVSPNK